MISDTAIDETWIIVSEQRVTAQLGASARRWEMIQISVAHNHPTGDPSPSRDDIALTREVRNALKTVGVSLHDHIIIGRKGHCSLRSLKVIDGWQ
jgi:DNA repair protein RadC